MGVRLVIVHKVLGVEDFKRFEDSAFREVGVAMSFLLIQYVAHAYGHFWEQRGAIGTICGHAKSLCRKVCCTTEKNPALVQAVIRATARRSVLFFTALRLKLENADDEAVACQLERFLAFEDVAKKNAVPPLVVLGWITQDVRLLLNEGCIAPPLVGAIEAELSALNDGFHKCMKLHTTPVPVPFRQLLSLGLIIFAILIPVPFVDDWGWYLCVPASMASLFLFGMGFLGGRLYSGYSPDGEAKGVPLIDMVTMGLATQKDCWGYIHGALAYEARKARLLGGQNK